ncbi:MAG TPA: electron transfer flavoprotein subunit alpha/FixB family protein [Phycisphaerae bacterium]|nr:electron transfer flavoprotein subunit alpha/FixB family protein [Phycisphaerae bacterium]
MSNDVLIFAEQRDNRVHAAVAQIATPARALAGKLGGQLVACLVGDKVDQAAEAVARTGVDRIVTVSDPSLAAYSALRYRSALEAVASRIAPRVLLLPATFMGRDLAPRVAARLRGALATDVIELDIAEGALRVRRPVYNGKALCQVHFPAGRLAIASVRPNTFPAATGGGGAARESLNFSPSPGDERLTTREVVKTGGAVKDVTEADIIVSGGRALKSEENFKIIYDLARELDAAVGASRAACDAGYQPHSRQVGLTGKTVTPKLYIACGISGAIQHLAGMRGSKRIVAINTDPEAPLMKVADYAVVGDLFKVVPALTEEVRKLRH